MKWWKIVSIIVCLVCCLCVSSAFVGPSVQQRLNVPDEPSAFVTAMPLRIQSSPVVIADPILTPGPPIYLYTNSTPTRDT